MFTTSSEIQVRYKETDMMGVVYHGNYFTWFEVARVNMLDEIGLSYVDLEKKGYIMPVLECHAEFLSPARFHDKLTVKVIIKTPPRARTRIDYEVFCGEKLLCRGYTVHGFINAQGTPIRPPQYFLDRLNEILGKQP